MTVLERDFFRRDADLVAPELVGKLIVSTVGGQRVVARITETEAYRDDDPASHTHRGRTPRNAVMFDDPGHLYVYLSYGMHHCANAVSHADGRSGGVLLRSGRILEGAATAGARRGHPRSHDQLGRGPGCLAQALGFTLAHGGADLCRVPGPVQILSDGAQPPISSGPRVGVRLAADVPWRFWATGERSVSTYKRSPRAEPATAATVRSINS